MFWCVQAMAVISGFRLRWPTQPLELMQALSFANLNIDLVKPECSVDGFVWLNRYFIMMSLPLFFCVAIFAAVAVRHLFKRWRLRRATTMGVSSGTTPTSVTTPAAGGGTPGAGRVPLTSGQAAELLMLTALKLLYLVSAQYSMTYFDCTRVGTTSPFYVFDADTSLRCDGPSILSTQYAALAITGVVVYVLGIPAALMLGLGRRPVSRVAWAALRCKARAPAAPDGGGGPGRVALELGRDYRPEMWFWDLAILTRKLLILVPELFAAIYAELQVRWGLATYRVLPRDTSIDARFLCRRCWSALCSWSRSLRRSFARRTATPCSTASRSRR